MSDQYWLMNGIEDRFQEFAENWNDGVRKTDEIDVSKIDTVPMAFFSGTRDMVCTNSQGKKYTGMITAEVTNFYDVEGQNHDYFSSMANDDWFMSRLITELQVPT